MDGNLLRVAARVMGDDMDITTTQGKRHFTAALQEITAVMMETARKGMWKASEQQLKDIAALHTELVNSYAPACSQFVCDNARLRDFIASRTEARAAAQYQE